MGIPIKMPHQKKQKLILYMYWPYNHLIDGQGFFHKTNPWIHGSGQIGSYHANIGKSHQTKSLKPSTESSWIDLHLNKYQSPLEIHPSKCLLLVNYHALRIQIYPKKGISPTILLRGWDWDHQSYSTEGSGFLGILDHSRLMRGRRMA